MKHLTYAAYVLWIMHTLVVTFIKYVRRPINISIYIWHDTIYIFLDRRVRLIYIMFSSNNMRLHTYIISLEMLTSIVYLKLIQKEFRNEQESSTVSYTNKFIILTQLYNSRFSIQSVGRETSFSLTNFRLLFLSKQFSNNECSFSSFNMFLMYIVLIKNQKLFNISFIYQNDIGIHSIYISINSQSKLAYKSHTTKHTRKYKHNIGHANYKYPKFIQLHKRLYTIEELSNILIYINNHGNNNYGNTNEYGIIDDDI